MQGVNLTRHDFHGDWNYTISPKPAALQQQFADKSLGERTDYAMFEAAGEWEMPLNIAFLAVTAFIAWHGIRFRDDEGKGEFVHQFFGCIAAVFFILVLLQDVLGVVEF